MGAGQLAMAVIIVVVSVDLLFFKYSFENG